MRELKKKNKVIVSAPGKLMLLGEHAVVYGYPCLVTAVNNRLFITAEFETGDSDKITAPQVKESNFVKETISIFKRKYKITSPVHIETRSEFSHTVGFGSSSAVTVATLKALSVLFEVPLSKKEIFDLSYQVVLAIQGVGSGFDVAVADYGKTLYFIGGGKEISPVLCPKLSLVVGYSGVKADTPTLVRKVKVDYDKNTSKINKIFLEIETLVKKGKVALIRNDLITLGKLMSRNHTLLKELGVSTDKLDHMVDRAVEGGAFGAKLSGAGGGDCMIALTSVDKRDLVVKAIEKAGGQIMDVQVNAEGIKIENGFN